jgi:hypothetical protein
VSGVCPPLHPVVWDAQVERKYGANDFVNFFSCERALCIVLVLAGSGVAVRFTACFFALVQYTALTLVGCVGAGFE